MSYFLPFLFFLNLCFTMKKQFGNRQSEKTRVGKINNLYDDLFYFILFCFKIKVDFTWDFLVFSPSSSTERYLFSAYFIS